MFKYFSNDKLSLPLKVVIIIPFVMILVTTITLIEYWNWQNKQKMVKILIQQTVNEVETRIKHDVLYYTNLPKVIGEQNKNLIALKVLDLENFEILERHFLKQIKSDPSLQFVGFGNQEGDFLGVERSKLGELQLQLATKETGKLLQIIALNSQEKRGFIIEKKQNYDPRKTSWYLRALYTKKPVWSPIQALFDSQNLAIFLNYPLFQESLTGGKVDPSDLGKDRGQFYTTNQKFVGTIRIGFDLAHISQFLQGLKVSRSGQTFILETSGLLVASSHDPVPFKISGDGEERHADRIFLKESSHPLLQTTGKYLDQNWFKFKNLHQQQDIYFKIADRNYFLHLNPLQDEYGLDWLVGVVVPEDDFLDEIKALNTQKLSLVIVAVLGAIVIGYLGARSVTKSIESIQKASKAIALGHWDQKISSYGIEEFKDLTSSFNWMGSELQNAFNTLEDKVAERTAKLAKAETELRQIFNAMRDLIFVFDGDGNYLKIIAKDSEKVLADQKNEQSLEDIFEPVQAQEFLNYIRQVLETKEPITIEYSLLIQGELVWESAIVSPLSDQTVLWVARNINDRKILEEQLRTSEQRMRTVFESMTDIVLVIDERGEIEVPPTNPVFYPDETGEMFDRLQLTLEQFWSSQPGEGWWVQIREVISTQTPRSFDYNLTVGEREIWFSARISPMSQHSALWVARDITDRRQAEAALAKAKEAAIAASEAKSTFLANMSHELRSPLNAILGFAQLLAEDSHITPEARENAEIITRSGEHLLGVINQVLDISKIEAGRTTLNESDFDLQRLFDDLREMFRLKAKEKELYLLIVTDTEVPESIKGDRLKLRQILINLLSNAIKFTQMGGVTLTVQSQEIFAKNYLTFRVQDTGPGIKPAELDSIFEAFVQTETGKSSQQGTGLGLSIAYAFVNLMGGELQVTSVVGQGTTFSFQIPVTIGKKAVSPPPQPQPQVISLAPNQPVCRLLIVDDQPLNRRLLRQLLKPIGFEVAEASNGQEAIEVWRTWQPHLIWMDMRMPVLNGYEATKQIKSSLQGQATAIIALTASALTEERSMILLAGCDDFIRKPFQTEEIFATISKHLGVRYIYKEPSLIQADEPLTTMDTGQKLDATMRESLKQAILNVDPDAIEECFAQISSEHPAIVHTLQNYLHNFEYDKILQFLDT